MLARLKPLRLYRLASRPDKALRRHATRDSSGLAADLQQIFLDQGVRQGRLIIPPAMPLWFLESVNTLWSTNVAILTKHVSTVYEERVCRDEAFE